MNCEIYPKELAIVKVTYGLFSEYNKGRPHYIHYLSNKGSIKLWNLCSILVSSGKMYWKNEKINSK